MKALVTTLAAAALVAVFATGASGRGAAGSQFFEDRVGDNVNGVPDISRIDVANDDQGFVTFSFTFANHSSDFQPNEGFLVLMDTTGDGRTDYLYAGVKDHTGLFRPDGVQLSPTTLTSQTVSGVPSFRINRAELGNASTITFVVGSTRNNGASFGDIAPDSGAYTYRLTLPSAPPPTTTTTPKPPAATARFVVAASGAPHAGRAFVVRSYVQAAGKNVAPSAIACTAKVGGVNAKVTAVNGPAPYRGCSVAIPKTAAGKKLSITMLITYKGVGTTRKLSYVVRA